MAWFRFLKDVTQWAICYPAMAYIAACDEVFYRRSMLTDAVEIMKRCDILVLVGPRLSPHMRIEIGAASGRASGALPVLDLLDLGAAPPWERKDEAGIEVLRRADALGL